MSLREVLMKAVRTEEEGYRLYSEEAAKTKHPLVKGLFEELAYDERVHAHKFRKLLETLEATGKVEYSSEELPSIEGRVKDVFEKIGEVAALEEGEPYIQALKTALELEKESYRMYNSLWKESDDPQAKAYYDVLRKEEYGHLASLENVLAYLTKSGMWFDVEESKRWNWMNM